MWALESPVIAMMKLNWNGKIVSSQSEFCVTHWILRHTRPMLCTVIIFYPGKQPKCKNPTFTYLVNRSSTEAKHEHILPSISSAALHLCLHILGAPKIQDHLCKEQQPNFVHKVMQFWTLGCFHFQEVAKSEQWEHKREGFMGEISKHKHQDGGKM